MVDFRQLLPGASLSPHLLGLGMPLDPLRTAAAPAGASFELSAGGVSGHLDLPSIGSGLWPSPRVVCEIRRDDVEEARGARNLAISSPLEARPTNIGDILHSLVVQHGVEIRERPVFLTIKSGIERDSNLFCGLFDGATKKQWEAPVFLVSQQGDLLGFWHPTMADGNPGLVFDFGEKEWNELPNFTARLTTGSAVDRLAAVPLFMRVGADLTKFNAHKQGKLGEAVTDALRHLEAHRFSDVTITGGTDVVIGTIAEGEVSIHPTYRGALAVLEAKKKPELANSGVTPAKSPMANGASVRARTRDPRRAEALRLVLPPEPIEPRLLEPMQPAAIISLLALPNPLHEVCQHHAPEGVGEFVFGFPLVEPVVSSMAEALASISEPGQVSTWHTAGTKIALCGHMVDPSTGARGFAITTQAEDLGFVIEALYANPLSHPVQITLLTPAPLITVRFQQWCETLVWHLRERGYRQVTLRSQEGTIIAASDALPAAVTGRVTAGGRFDTPGAVVGSLDGDIMSMSIPASFWRSGKAVLCLEDPRTHKIGVRIRVDRREKSITAYEINGDVVPPDQVIRSIRDSMVPVRLVDGSAITRLPWPVRVTYSYPEVPRELRGQFSQFEEILRDSEGPILSIVTATTEYAFGVMAFAESLRFQAEAYGRASGVFLAHTEPIRIASGMMTTTGMKIRFTPGPEADDERFEMVRARLGFATHHPISRDAMMPPTLSRIRLREAIDRVYPGYEPFVVVNMAHYVAAGLAPDLLEEASFSRRLELLQQGLSSPIPSDTPLLGLLLIASDDVDHFSRVRPDYLQRIWQRALGTAVDPTAYASQFRVVITPMSPGMVPVAGDVGREGFTTIFVWQGLEEGRALVRAAIALDHLSELTDDLIDKALVATRALSMPLPDFHEPTESDPQI